MLLISGYAYPLWEVIVLSEEFLRKFYEITGEEYKVYDKYKAGREIGLTDTETDDIVDDLSRIGFIKKIKEDKILITFEGKEAVCKMKSD